MSNVYSTDSDEHLVNIEEMSEPQWDDLTEIELEQDLMDSRDEYMDKDKEEIYDIISLEDVGDL